MSVDRFKLKMDAKAKIKATDPSPYFTTIVYLVIIILISLLNDELNGRFDSWWGLLSRGVYPLPPLSGTLYYSGIFIILLNVVSNVIAVGYSWYTIRISRALPAALSNMFDIFNVSLKVFGLCIVILVFTFLWTLLFVIPGIVAHYRYRQAIYILYEHPDYGIMQCIHESKAMMVGYKADLFVLDLSFLGWAILGVFTFGVLYIWLLPYYYVTAANFYNSLSSGYVQGGGRFDQ